MPSQGDFDFLDTLIKNCREEWYLFAKYCDLRKKGLRSEALKCLNEFIESAVIWDFEPRKEFVIWLLSLGEGSPDFPNSLAIPDSLDRKLITPTIKEWALQKPADHRCFRWLGRWFDGGKDALRKALQIQPEDQLARYVLIRSINRELWNSIQCLDKDKYLGNPKVDLELIDEAGLLIDGFKDEGLIEPHIQSIEKIKQLIQDYLEFKEQGENNFVEWCMSKGRDYPWFPRPL